MNNPTVEWKLKSKHLITRIYKNQILFLYIKELEPDNK
jgi:hypothetical protein